jgi:hypothetical protein
LGKTAFNSFIRVGDKVDFHSPKKIFVYRRKAMSNKVKNDQPEQPGCASSESETCADVGGECPEIYLATEAVRLAKAELEKAEKFYEDIRRQAADKIRAVRETTVGDVIDKALVTVKRHPGPSLIICAAMGFCLGRWFQRLFKK